MKLFSTEQVSKYHPDKYADQISDAVLAACLAQDPYSRVACECMVKDGYIVLGGEIRTNAKVNYEQVAKSVARKLKYKVNKVINLIGQQSNEIYNGTTKAGGLTGAGDQGIMFGYATNETESYLPYAFDLANKIIKTIEYDVEHNPNTILRGDAKTQVTTDLDQKQDISAIYKILVSVCHNKRVSIVKVRDYITNLLQPLLQGFNGKLIINPAGLWTIGGPTADCGLTGRKIVCDQYGGFCAVGGGAFSGKDPSKVDRSAAYMARHIAVDVVKKFTTVKTCEVQLAYAIGQADPMSVRVIVDGLDAPDYIYKHVTSHFKLTPSCIIDELGLLCWNYEKVAEGCHFRENINWNFLSTLIEVEV
ncbi:MAG: methionine adenosyltransferase [Clostridia bacterium]|nr:methionine adenosyltransferase [Clostridia bacterium]